MFSPLTPQEILKRRDLGIQAARAGNVSGLPLARFGVLSTFNADMIRPFLTEALTRAGFHGEIYIGGFGQIAQEALIPNSELSRFNPDFVWIIASVEDLLSAFFERPAAFQIDQASQLASDRAADLRYWVQAILDRHPRATCFVTLIGAESAPCNHVLDPASPERGQSIVEHLRAEITNLSGLSPRVVVLDWDWHIRAGGSAAYRDRRLWYLARMRLNPAGLATLCDLLVSRINAYRGGSKKVAVLDLDNTLWGGVVGETGVTGLALGGEGVGLAFQDVQRELLRLNDTGIVLAICSKNNPADAWEVFDSHPEMILKREHIAAFRINWADKASNLRELAEELNLGLDSFVFLDDNPVERQWIRRSVPEALAPDLPAEVVEWPSFLAAAGFFERIALTKTDRERAQTYQAQGQRSQLRSRAASVEDFLASLEQRVTIELVTRGSVARTAQMCQRTNQFNLTTRRYTPADIEQMMSSADVEAYTVAVRDIFGDNGITGVAILRYTGAVAEIDSFLLSCRILGRRVEDEVLAFLKARAAARGAIAICGKFVPTPKNGHTALFYPDRGFASDGDGAYSLALTHLSSPIPPVVREDIHA